MTNAKIICLIAVLAVTTQVTAHADLDSGPANYVPGKTPLSSDSTPDGPGEVIIPAQYQVTGHKVLSASTGTVYFTPQDESGSVTCLFFYNTSAQDEMVAINTFSLTGDPEIDTAFMVPSGELVRACSDTVAAIGSWSSALLINFTTSSTYGRIQLPDGVRVDGFVAWNGGSEYDPQAPVPTLQLRFVRPLQIASTVYFTPQDESGSVTCMFFYNVGSASQTVELDTFTLTGSTNISTTIDVPAGELKRVCADTAAAIGTWTDTQLVNFTTSSAYGRLRLPPGVLAEGYVAWNGGTTYDPQAAVPTLELRFDTYNLFMDGFELP